MGEISSIIQMDGFELARIKEGKKKRAESKEMICFKLKLTS